MTPRKQMTKSNSSDSSQIAEATAAPKGLLDGIRAPADIKALREQDLPQLAQEVRDELIRVLSQTGGHLGPNLGVVELTIALHRVFDTPRDRFVMDVSHQGYVHKLFTGRLDRFSTMRQFGGLNGFLLRTESEHDCYGAGHAGTALSAALGMAVGRDLKGGGENIVVIAGDAAFTNGISYEALNNIKSQTKRFIVVLNDNEWSIAKNVGAIANYFNRIVTSETYAHLHDKARDFVEWILGKTRAKFADNNQKLVAITAAMPSGTGLSHFAKAHPTRYFDVGIAEEHAALFACGIATQGLTPFLTIYSTFFQRAYDMAIHDMAIQKLNVRLCMDRAGLSGDDGPTHHGLFDIGYLRHIPNWIHMQPKNEDEFVDMLWTMANYNSGPIAVRYPRGSGTGAQIKPEPKLLEIGKAEVVKHGRDVAIFGLGNMFEVAEEAAKKLEEKGISVALINPRWIKPMDTGTLEFFARSVEVVATIEDHVLHNGFGCAVMEHLHSQQINTPVARVGWPDEFIEHGAVPLLRKKHGITADALAEKVLSLLKKKPAAKTSVA